MNILVSAGKKLVVVQFSIIVGCIDHRLQKIIDMIINHPHGSKIADTFRRCHFKINR